MTLSPVEPQVNDLDDAVFGLAKHFAADPPPCIRDRASVGDVKLGWIRGIGSPANQHLPGRRGGIVAVLPACEPSLSVLR